MVVRRRDIALELWDIAKTRSADISSSFIEQLSSHLKKEGNLTLKSNLSEVINTRLINEEEEGRYAFETTSNQLNDAPAEKMTDEELFQLVFDGAEKEQNPNFSVLRGSEDEINELLFKHARLIAPHNRYLPLEEWDVTSLSFYCILWGYDASIEDLLFALFHYSEKNAIAAFDFESYADLIHKLETGYKDAKTVLQLLLDARLEGNQTVQNQNPIKSPENTGKKRLNQSVSNDVKYFELNTTYNKLKGFRAELEHLGYINRSLSTDTFRRVFLFQDDPLRDKLKLQAGQPIEWLINKSHLGHLIKLLYLNKIITDKDYYKIAENCFLFDGEPIPNTVFHKMQPPAPLAKRKIAQMVDALK